MHLLFKCCDRFIALLRAIKFYLYIRLCGGKIVGLPKVGGGVVWKYPPHSGISIGKKFDVGHACFFEIDIGKDLNIGNNVKLTHSVTISCLNKIQIGNDTLIAEFCSLRDSTHGTESGQLIRLQNAIHGTIEIGNDVWIGRNVSVFGDVKIEDGAVIGANSLCSKKTFAKNTINVGIPCAFLKDRS